MTKGDPHEIIKEAIDQNYTDFYVAYSGGKDSGIVLDFISKEYPQNFKGVIYVDTGIATNMTLKFVKNYCKDHNYKLNLLHSYDVKRKKESKYGKPGDPFTFENLVLNYGFPKASGHNITMAWLKYYPIRQFIQKKIKDNEKPAIISGVRKKESKRRSKRKSYSNHINHDGYMTFVCPLFYKSNNWVSEYYIKNNIKRSPVYKTLHISGDCLCGCFAKKEELKLLEMFHPEVFAEIKRLEKLIKEKGSLEAQNFTTWANNNKSTSDVESQTTLESAICSECFFDNDNKENDTKRFDKEMAQIEKKLEHLKP